VSGKSSDAVVEAETEADFVNHRGWALSCGERISIPAGEVVSSRSMGSGNDSTDSALVDESLIDAMWALTPEERLRQNDRMVRTVLLLRRGWEAMNAPMKAVEDGRER
jgi:hypothetical protein